MRRPVVQLGRNGEVERDAAPHARGAERLDRLDAPVAPARPVLDERQNRPCERLRSLGNDLVEPRHGRANVDIGADG
jgi:hypothetical protein